MPKDKQKNADLHVSLKIILKNNKGQTLGLKMPNKSSMPGYYDLLGGRIRENELRKPFREIINREIEEEIGKQVRYKINETPVSVGRHHYFSKINQKEQYIFWVFFEASYLGGKIKLSSEHERFSWLNLNKNNLKKYFVRGPLEGISHYMFKKFPSKSWIVD